MLKAHPETLATLVGDYERLAALAEECGGDLYRRRDDAAYTLCVSTGTRDIDSALAVARDEIPTPAGAGRQRP